MTKFYQQLFIKTLSQFLDLDESLANCQSGAWQHLLKERLNIHPCLTSERLPYAVWSCRLCGRRRKCHEEIHLWGFGYNSSTLRGKRKFESDVTSEEKAAGLHEKIGEDDTVGVRATIGPYCMKELRVLTRS